MLVQLHVCFQKILPEGKVSQNFDTGPGFIFVICNVKNIVKRNDIFYVTSKIN